MAMNRIESGGLRWRHLGLLLGGIFAGLGVWPSCSVRNCPSDVEVMARFQRMRPSLDRLQRLLEKDGYAVSYLGKGQVDASGRPLSESRRAEYLEILKDLGDVSVHQNDGSLNVVLWSDGVSIASHSRYKSIQFLPAGDSEHISYRGVSMPSLDGLENQDKDGLWVRPLGEGWYIVYMETR